MTKRISRKALALAAIGVIAAPAFATVANAQIGTQAIATTLKAVGPVPSGVTGASVSISCKNTTNNPGDVVAAFSLTPGQTATIPSFQLNSASSCRVTSTNAGSANTSLGTITISIGGATSSSTIGAFATGSGPTVATGYVPVVSATDIQITMSYPLITVKKVVVGDEATAGFAYPMSIACSNPTDARFISPANGLEGGSVTIATTTGTAAVAAQRAFIATSSAAVPAVWSYGWLNTAANGWGPTGTVVTAYTISLAPASTVPFAFANNNNTPGTGFPTLGTFTNPTAFISTPAVAAVALPAGYAANDVVVPVPGSYVLVPVYNGTTLVTNYAVFDALTAGTLPTVTGATSILGNAAGIASIVLVATNTWNGPSTTPSAGFPLVTGTAVGAISKLDYVRAVLINAANLTAGVAATSTASTLTIVPFNTNPVPAGALVGNWANLGTGDPSLYTQVLAQILKEKVGGAVAPNTAAGFTGSFALKGGESKSFSFNEFPNLTVGSKCEVWETNGGGATATGFSSTNGTAAPLGGVNNSAGRWQSNLTAMNETITVTNSFYGDMIISKVVTGDPKTNIATYEISVACDKGGPKDTFLIKDRQSKVYQNIASGTNCLITETKSDGAVASYKDNSGDNTTDGRVTIKRRPIGGCGDVLSVTGSPTNATPGGPAPTTTFNECWASVIITNDYNPPATTEAPKAPAAAPATAAPATAAPAVAPAPAVAVDATPTFAG